MNKNMGDGFSSIRNDIDSLKRNDIEPLKNEVKEMNETVKASLHATNNRIDDLEIQLKEKDAEIKSLKKLCETQKRQNNIVVFNLPDTEKSVQELGVAVVDLFSRVLNCPFSVSDLNDVYRIGKKGGKCRPVLVSLVSHMKLKSILANKQAFRHENIGVSQDYSKEINEERKRLQPMVTSLNQSGKKAVLKMDELYVDGTKWGRLTIEEELSKFNSKSPRQKRPRSPNDVGIPKRAMTQQHSFPSGSTLSTSSNPLLNLNIPRSTEEENSSTPSTPTSKPARMFPVFQGGVTNVLSPLPGGKANSKAFGVISDTD